MSGLYSTIYQLLSRLGIHPASLLVAVYSAATIDVVSRTKQLYCIPLSQLPVTAPAITTYPESTPHRLRTPQYIAESRT